MTLLSYLLIPVIRHIARLGSDKGKLSGAALSRTDTATGSPEQEVVEFPRQGRPRQENKLKPVKMFMAECPCRRLFGRVGWPDTNSLYGWLPLANRFNRIENNGVGRKGNIQS